MALKGKPLWLEGMFLRPQHFQQYDRWLEHLVDERVRSLGPNGWGVRRLQVDEDALKSGQFRLTAVDAVLADGTVFSAPGDQPLPPARLLRAQDAGKRVFLAVPMRLPGAVEVADGGERRYRTCALDVADNTQAGSQAVEIAVGALSARFVIEGEPLDELVAVPVARLAPADAPDGRLLAETFMPPLLDVSASPRLCAIMEHVRGLLHSRAEALAEGIGGEGGGTRAGMLDVVLLGVVNRHAAIMRHLVEMRHAGPERVYAACVGLVGELSAYGEDGRRLPECMAYDHADPGPCFEDLLGRLRRMLSVIVHRTAFAIPLAARDYGIWLGDARDKPFAGERRYVLIVRAQTGLEVIRRQLPGQIKIGPVEQIRDLVNLQLPGIVVAPLSIAPREIPFVQDAVYFELEQGNALWARMKDSAALALHVSGEYPGLALELWAIERSATP